jgi:hypothetical protein
LTDGTATLSSGALSGATDVDGSGDLTMGTVTMTGFSVDADGDVVSKSLDNTSGGITNTGSIAGATTIDGSGDLTMGTITMTGLAVDASGNLNLDANLDMDGTTATFDASGVISLDAGAASNFTTSAGALTLDGAGGVNVAGNAAEVDVTTTGAVDVNGAGITIDATSGLSMDAAAASNFTTSAGALTLEGAGGVTVTSTGGNMTLNGTGQTVDLDASTLDVDATTITVDATTTTFTGKVEGPNATADNQFTTYYQLDSLANRAPFNETLRRFRLGTSQSITTAAGATRVSLSGSGIYTESSDPVENPVDPLNPPMSVQSTGGQHINLSDPGIYQVMLTMELSNANVADALALVEIYNYDALQTVFPTLRVLASDTEEVYGTGNAFTGVNSHLNLSMTFEADNSNEDIYIEITTYGANIDIEGYGFTVSRIGEQ